MKENQQLYKAILRKTNLNPKEKADKNILFSSVRTVLRNNDELIGFQENWNLNAFLHSGLIFTLKQYDTQMKIFRNFCQEHNLTFKPTTLRNLTNDVRGDMNCLIVVLEKDNVVYFKPLTVHEAIMIAIGGLSDFNKKCK